MEKFDYNIEFAHIYADEKFGEEQIKSIEILKKIISKLSSKNKTFVTTVLIDEFNPTFFKLDDSKIISLIKNMDVPFDFFCYESKFGAIADLLIKEIPSSKLSLEQFNNPEKEVLFIKDLKDKIGIREDYHFSYKHTCSLLAAAWTLCRLGVYPLPKGSTKKFNRKPFSANKLITILPKKYEKSEKKVLDIIRSTKFKKYIDKIEYVFY